MGPMLLQRLEQANSMGRVAMVTDKVNEVKGIMSDNINVLLENHAKVERLENQSEALMQAANTFKKGTRSIKRFYLMQNAKLGAAAGTAATVGVAAAAGTGVGLGVGLGLAATAGVATGVATTVTW